MNRPLALLAVVALFGADSLADEEPILQVPDGFIVEKVAGPPVVDRPIMAGFDDQGRLYVGEIGRASCRERV